MPLPSNVETCNVVGTFSYVDGTTPVGVVEFIPMPSRLADAGGDEPTTILSNAITAVVDSTGSIDVDLPATDDPDLNPTAWTYLVHVRLEGTGHYSFNMAAPTGAILDITAVTPADESDGTVTIVGPPGPRGPPPAALEDP